MPGILVSGSSTNSPSPVVNPWPLANSLTGSNTSTTPGSLYEGDIVVPTNSATYALGNGVTDVVIRPLTYQDLITNSLNHGLLGVCPENLITNANGQISATPTFGQSPPSNVTYQLASPSARFPVDQNSLRNQLAIPIFGASNRFKGKILPTYTTGPMGQNLQGLLAGLSIITGVPTPVAPTLATSATAGTLLNIPYYVVIGYQGMDSAGNLFGQGLVSPQATVTPTANQSFTVAAPATLTNLAPNFQIYVGTTSGGPYYLQGTTQTVAGGTVTISAYSTTGANPPAVNTTGQPGVSMYYLDPGASTKCIRIRRVYNIPGDAPNGASTYGTTFATGNLNPGPICEFTCVSSYAFEENASTQTPYTN